MPKLIGGISGTAELVLCEITNDRVINGKLIEGTYFRAVGRILTPIRYAGEDTEITRSLGIEPFWRHYQWVINELRKLGMKITSTTIDLVEPGMSDLVKRTPVFKFHTWTPSSNMFVIVHEWCGLVGGQHV